MRYKTLREGAQRFIPFSCSVFEESIRKYPHLLGNTNMKKATNHRNSLNL
jgi:hypothetical protein